MEKLSPPTSIPPAPVFRGFDIADDFWCVPGYRRNLPHWRLEGASYFTTFRLADSLPEVVLKRWAEEEADWLHAHGITVNWRRDEPDRFYQALTSVPREEMRLFEKQQARQFFLELDLCHGACVLRQPNACRIVHDALLHFHGQRMWMGDFVVMPNHVHVIVQPFPGIRLEEWLYSIKRFTATQIARLDEADDVTGWRNGHLWQAESFDRVVRDESELARTRDYIAKNPARLKDGEYVLHRADWPFCSSSFQ